MIIEGLVTCADGDTAHVAALGPVVDPQKSQWMLRPYQTSRIFSLLRQHGECVFHVIDDALPVVQLVVGQPPQLTLRPLSLSFSETAAPNCWIIEEACQWFRLHIEHWNTEQPRSEARAVVVDQGQLRPFWGWNRAKHALLEAAILISRWDVLPRAELLASIQQCRVAIEKTAGPNEWVAWDLIQSWIATRTHASHC